MGHTLFDLTRKQLKNFQIPLFYIPISDDRPRVAILHTILQTSLVLKKFFLPISMMRESTNMWSTSKTLGKTFTVVVFEVFETGVELDAIDDFFS